MTPVHFNSLLLFTLLGLEIATATDVNAAEPPGPPSLSSRPIGYNEWRETGEYPKSLVLGIANERIPNQMKLMGWVVLRNPAHTAKRQPQTAVFNLARRQLEADADMHWSKRPPVLQFSPAVTFATTSALFDATGPGYALVEGQVFPFYDQVLLVKDVGLNEVSLVLVSDRIPKESRPIPGTRVIPINLEHGALFCYKSQYTENTKTWLVEAYDLVRVLKIDGDSGEAQIRLTPTIEWGVMASTTPATVITVSKGGLLSAHGISYRVLNIVPPQNLSGVGQLVGWVELEPDPVAVK